MRIAVRFIPTVVVALALAGFLAVSDGSAAAERPYVSDSNPAICAANVAYLEQHADPHFAIECPVNLAGAEVSATCVPAIWPTGCPEASVIRLSARACLTAVKDEASNSWVLWSYARSGQIPDRVRQGGVPDWPGQYGIDDWGEC